jgi:hypothetical protein
MNNIKLPLTANKIGVSAIGIIYEVRDADHQIFAESLFEHEAQAIVMAVNVHEQLVVALNDVLTVFRECVGNDAFAEFAGTSQHGPQVRSHRIVDAIALLKSVTP